jgi:hypothetical protein
MEEKRGSIAPPVSLPASPVSVSLCLWFPPSPSAPSLLLGHSFCVRQRRGTRGCLPLSMAPCNTADQSPRSPHSGGCGHGGGGGSKQARGGTCASLLASASPSADVFKGAPPPSLPSRQGTRAAEARVCSAVTAHDRVPEHRHPALSRRAVTQRHIIKCAVGAIKGN